MLLNIYYIIGLLILVMSFSNMINFIKFFKIRNWALTFRRVTGKDVDSKDFRSREDYNIFTIYSTFLFIEIIWLLFGIASSSWYVFLTLIVMNLIISFVTRNFKVKFVSKSLGLIYNIFKFSTILFLILNHFHFHIDLLTFFS